MKTKIGERESKAKIGSLKGLLKAYPGAAVLAALVLVGGISAGAISLADNSDEAVLDNNKVMEETVENKDDTEEKAETSVDNTEETKEEESKEAETKEEESEEAVEEEKETEETPEKETTTEENSSEKENNSTENNNNTSTSNNTTTTTETQNNNTNNTESSAQTSTEANKQEAVKKEEEAKEENKKTEINTTEATTEEPKSLSAKAKKYKSEINKDIIGWINIPNTNVNYPVTHTSNNTYYMNYNIYKQWDSNGALVADYECNFNSGLPTNTIIYGHNWTNCVEPLADNNTRDVMFAQVHAFANADFAAKTPYIYFSTTQKDYKYQVFAAFYTHQNWTDYIYAYPDASKFSNVIKTAKKESLHDYNVNVTTSDKIISLSTCTRMKGSTDQYRFVVMGKLVD